MLHGLCRPGETRKRTLWSFDKTRSSSVTCNALCDKDPRMVNLSVPKNYTFSPSSATPHLTINRDVVADLDSSNAFEGTFGAIDSVWCHELTYKRPGEAP